MRRRRRIILIFAPLLILAALGGWVGYQLRPERLTQLATAVLRERLGSAVRIDSVRFRLLATIHVAGLQIATSDGSAIHIAEADLICGLGDLFVGRIEPERVLLRGLKLDACLRGSPSAGGDAGIEAHLGPLAAQFGTLDVRLARLPQLEITDGEIILRRGDALVTQRVMIKAEGRHLPNGYQLAIQRSDGVELGTARWDSSLDAFDLSTGWIDLGSVVDILPPALREPLAATRSSARVRVERLVLAARPGPTGAALLDRVRSAELEFDRVAALIPTGESLLAGDAPIADSAPDLYRLRDGVLRAAYSTGVRGGGLLAISGDGVFGGAALRVRATLDADVLRRALAKEADAIGAIVEAEMQASQFQLPTPATHPRLLTSSALPGPLRAAFEDYEPRGVADLTVRLAPRLTDEPIERRLSAEIEPRGAVCRYTNFPYAFDDVRGRILLADGRVVLDGLTGRHGPARVTARGALNNTTQWTGFELAFDATGVPLDDALFAALPQEYQAVWREADPRGVADVQVRLRRAEGSETAGKLKPWIEVVAQLDGASVLLGDAGRLERAAGRVSIRDQVVELADFTGWLNDAQTTIDGTVSVGAPATAWDLDIRARDIALSESSTALDDDDPNTPPEAIRIEARADLTGHVRGTHGASVERQLSAAIKRGTLSGFCPEAVWSDLSGTATLRSGVLQLDALQARQGDAALQVRATLPAAPETPVDTAVELRLEGPQLDTILPQFTPAAWRAIAGEIGLRGAGAVRVELRRPLAGEPAARIEVLDAALRSPRLPLDLRDVRADVRLGPSRFDVVSASARWGEAGELSGRGVCAWDDATIDLKGELRALQLALTPELVDALPEAVAQTLRRLDARGGFSLELDTFEIAGAAPFTWRFAGRMPFRLASLRVGVPIESAFGELRGSGSFTPGGDSQLNATFVLDRAQAAGVELSGWHGRMTRAGPGAPLRLDELAGRVAGGDALGSATIDPERGAYQLALTLRDIPLDALLPPGDSDQSRTARGRLDGQLALEGVGDDVATRRGGGQARIRGASFLQAPLLVSVFRASPLGLRGNEDIDSAEVSFRWDGAAVRLTRVDIFSREIRLIGEGVWFPADNRVELTLVGAHPRDWPRLAMVTDLIESAAGEIVQFRVAGTLARPTVSAQPLRRLDETLRRLLAAQR